MGTFMTEPPAPYDEIRTIIYQDELWTLREYHPALADFLQARDRLLVLRHGRPPYAVLLGVPHHAEVREDYICERRRDAEGRPAPRDADKNAASYALVAFTALRDRGVPCKLVIMAHPTTHDPNKDLASPYSRELFSEPARFLLECHGSGPHRRLALELSAGHNHLADARRFAQLLDAALGRRYTWGVQKAPGSRDAWIFHGDGHEEEEALELSALQTVTLIEAERRGMPALHLEAKPAFCKPADDVNAVSPDGLLLGRALAQALLHYLGWRDRAQVPG